MFIKYAFLIFITAKLQSDLKAQSYRNQYERCSEILNRRVEIDSLYIELLLNRDSCLRGSFAPDFNVTSIEDKKIELSKLKGSVVVLNFWYTGCIPCIEEMPALNKIVNLYSDEKVKFISFAPENNAVLKKFLIIHPFTFNIIPESENVRNDKFGLAPIWPYFIIIDQSGKIKSMWFGGKSDINMTLRNEIDNLLK